MQPIVCVCKLSDIAAVGHGDWPLAVLNDHGKNILNTRLNSTSAVILNAVSIGILREIVYMKSYRVYKNLQLGTASLSNYHVS